MIKRPINTRFRELVLRGEKTTTIRDKAWPVGKLIMLYSWSGEPYRSKQIDLCPVVVVGFWTIRITHLNRGGVMVYQCGKESGPALHKSEGFASREEMDEWFRPLVKVGETVTKTLMLFRRVEAQPPACECGAEMYRDGDLWQCGAEHCRNYVRIMPSNTTDNTQASRRTIDDASHEEWVALKANT